MQGMQEKDFHRHSAGRKHANALKVWVEHLVHILYLCTVSMRGLHMSWASIIGKEYNTVP